MYGLCTCNADLPFHTHFIHFLVGSHSIIPIFFFNFIFFLSFQCCLGFFFLKHRLGGSDDFCSTIWFFHVAGYKPQSLNSFCMLDLCYLFVYLVFCPSIFCYNRSQIFLLATITFCLERSWILGLQPSLSPIYYRSSGVHEPQMTRLPIYCPIPTQSFFSENHPLRLCLPDVINFERLLGSMW